MPGVTPLARALITGEAIRADIAAVLALLLAGEPRDLLGLLAPGTAVVIPMRGRGRTLGLLTLYFLPGSTVADEDLSTAQDVADRTGMALDNARLYNTQQQLGEELQLSLLT